MSHPVTNPPTPEGDDGEQFLSNADLGRRYNKSRMTIHRWQKAGYLPAPVLIGNKLPITSLSELRALEASLQSQFTDDIGARGFGRLHAEIVTREDRARRGVEFNRWITSISTG